jgi:nucleoside triphosphate pyrophosphatase
MMQTKRPLILASGSPRRQFLLKEAGFTFEIRKPDIDELYPNSVPVDKVAQFLALKKAELYREGIRDEIIITADTVVILDGYILNKPGGRNEAISMLRDLSGNVHRVMTGVCIMSREKESVFDDTTEVTFKPLSQEEVEFYVDKYKPFDKAGAYGAQDWIGMVAIQKIVGSYFNVMGLPIHKVYESLLDWSAT